MNRVKLALAAGPRAVRSNWRPMFWLYLSSLFGSLPLAWATGTVVNEYFGHRVAQDLMAERLDPILTFEFLMTHVDLGGAVVPAFLGGIFMWGALSTYLTGMVLMAVGSETALGTYELMTAGARSVGRLLRLLPMAFPFFGLTLCGPVLAAVYLGGDFIEDWISERSVFFLRICLGLGVGTVWVWAKGTYDLMRVEAVARGERRARYAFVRGLRHGLGHPLEVVLVGLPYAILIIVLTVGFSLIDVRIPRGTAILLVVGATLQQMVSFSREVLRVALAGSSVAYVRGQRGR